MNRSRTRPIAPLAAVTSLLTALAACSSEISDSAGNTGVGQAAVPAAPSAIPVAPSAIPAGNDAPTQPTAPIAPLPVPMGPATPVSTEAPPVQPNPGPGEVPGAGTEPPALPPPTPAAPSIPTTMLPSVVDNPGSPSSQTPPATGCPAVGGDGATFEVSDGDALEAALTSAAGGDTIVIAADIDDSISVRDLTFDPANPLWIVGNQTAVESIDIRDSVGISIAGLRIASPETSTYLKITNSQNVQVIRNTFDHTGAQEGQSSIITTGATDVVEIGCNTFQNIDFSGSESGSFIKTQWDEPMLTKNLHIHHNHFKGIAPVVEGGSVEGDSDREAIVFGISDTQDIITHHIVEFNLFEDCDGENEIITVKTSENTIRYNTFRNSLGSVSVRFGAQTDVYGNYFVADANNENAFANDTGGIRVYGSGHRIFNNYFEGLTGSNWRVPIIVDGGDTSDSSGGSGHERSTNVVVVNNTLVNCTNGIAVGTHYKLDARDTVFANNLFVNIENTMFDIGNESGSMFGSNMGTGGAVGVTLEASQLLEADPMLVLENSLYRLSDASPARDVGSTAFPFVAEDIDGNARAMPDIGADEFTNATPTRRILFPADVGHDAPEQ